MSNATMLSAAKRAAVERNTRIVQQVSTVGGFDPQIGGLTELIASALLATAAELRAKGEEMKAARRKGHVSTKAALDFAAGELGEVAESLALDGVDDAAMAAIRGASEIAGVGVSMNLDGVGEILATVLNPDVGDGPPFTHTMSAASFIGPDEGDIKLPPPPPPPKISDAATWPTLADWSAANVAGGRLTTLGDYWAAMRAAWPTCGLDHCSMAADDHPAGVMTCVADRPVGFVDCHCGASGKWPHMIGEAACVNEHPDKLKLVEGPTLAEAMAMGPAGIAGLRPSEREHLAKLSGFDTRPVVPPFADACGELPPDGAEADACVQKAGHAEREWAKDPDAKVRHVSTGGRRIWHVEPAGRVVRDQKEITVSTPMFKFAGAPAAPGTPVFAMAGAAPVVAVSEVFAHPAAPLRLPVLSRDVVMPKRMTWSRIESLADCAMKYRLQNVDPKIAGPDSPELVERPSWALVGGRAFDEMVNEVCAGVPATYDPGAAFVALLILEMGKQSKAAHQDYTSPTSWNAGSKREDEAWWRREGRRMAQDYYAWHLGRVRDGWTLLKGQQDVETELAGKPAFGRLDQLWLSPAGPGQHVEIVDCKSGSSPANPAQLGYYGTLIRRSGANGSALLRFDLDITLAAYDARKAVIVPHGMMSPALEEIAEFQAAEAWAQLEAQRFPANTTRGFGGCKSCPVRASCLIGRTR
jgi:hypothetical protein